MYIEFPDLDNPRFHRIFRRRFRMPYNCFVDLIELASRSNFFSRWRQGSVDAVKQQAAPLPLLILCSLRYLGRGWTFDDLSENTGISEEVIRVFLHRFISFGSTILYEKYVVAPSTSEEASAHSIEYCKAGLPGCIGSTDATHIPLERVEYRLRQNHLGFKMSHTARTYNITVNHRRRILSSTTGHPARWNNKTLILFDDFVVGLHEGRNLDDFTFELYERDARGNIVSAKYRGPWLIVDNGYCNWSTTIPPMKRTCDRSEIRFSQWLESIRKDVECTFGILKGRFRVLKSGIRLNGQEAAFKVFLTCCALHNWLLEVDGLDNNWEEGDASDWEGAMGNHDLQDVNEHLPFAVARLMSPTEMRAYDVAETPWFQQNNLDGLHQIQERRIEPNEARLNSQRESATAGGAVRVVKDLSMAYFRSKLIQHFDISFQRNEIIWPGKRNRVAHFTNL